mmetsp:Transcript_70359/g.205776  ORF Transcript_70359/g.205776 Transcript_70359/m.205776 type:complete len:264 (-) Transcript_70359:1037-1828(-)
MAPPAASVLKPPKFEPATRADLEQPGPPLLGADLAELASSALGRVHPAAPTDARVPVPAVHLVEILVEVWRHDHMPGAKAPKLPEGVRQVLHLEAFMKRRARSVAQVGVAAMLARHQEDVQMLNPSIDGRHPELLVHGVEACNGHPVPQQVAPEVRPHQQTGRARADVQIHVAVVTYEAALAHGAQQRSVGGPPEDAVAPEHPAHDVEQTLQPPLALQIPRAAVSPQAPLVKPQSLPELPRQSLVQPCARVQDGTPPMRKLAP